MTKLSTEELDELQNLNTEFTKLKISLGDLEIQKSQIISEIAAIKIKFGQNEKKLIEKYGQDSVINIQTGEVQQKKVKDVKNKFISYCHCYPSKTLLL